jgi:CubicO group peptidase (beta-lactamase class C family)
MNRGNTLGLRFILALSASLLAACVTTPSGPKPVPGKSLAEKLAPLEALLQQQVDAQKIPGAVVLVRRTDSDDVYLKAVGQLDREKGRPLTEDAIFRIASMTKPVTSTAVMMLVEEGKLNLDDPISKYLPEWKNPQVLGAPDPSRPGGYQTVPAKTPITVKHLLTHTSGLSYRFFGEPLAPFYVRAGVTDGFEHTSKTLAEQSAALASVPLKHEPGAAFTYGLSTDMLGHLVEKVSGKPLDQFLQERLFQPLGMKDTHFFLPPEKVSRLPALYRHTASGTLERVPETGANVQEGFGGYAPDFHYAGSKTYRSGGAGLVSTAADYSRFLQMLANGGELGGVRVLKKETVDAMTRNQIGTLRTDFVSLPFGLGFAVQDDPARAPQMGSVGTFFWSGVFRTTFWVDPEQKNLGVVMVNMWDLASDTPDDIRARIHQTLMQ